MKINKYFFFLIPFLLEFSNEKFNVNLSPLPYSLGYLSFIVVSFLCFKKFNRKLFFINFIPILIFWVGLLIGSFFADDFVKSISISIASIPYYFACAYFSYFLFERRNNKFPFILFFIVFLINAIYLISYVFSGNNFISYSSLTLGDNSLRNHHNIGFLISISALFFSTYFLEIKKNKFSISIFIVTSILLMLSESRSNFLLFIISFLTILIIKYNVFRFINIMLLIVIISIPLINYIGNFDFISQRFSISDTQYHYDNTDDRRAIYLEAPKYISSNIFGKGNKEFRIKIGDNNIVPHNMYITTLLSGGIISFIGLMMLIIRAYKSVKYLNFVKALSAYEKALASVMLIILFTFTTIDFFGFNLLILFSICFYFNYKASKFKTKNFV
jgi:hypothetical protein